MGNPIEIKKESERAVLVGLISREQTAEKLEEYLDELAFLAETAGAAVVKKFRQRLAAPDPKSFVGSGKLNEIRSFVKENDIGLVIFDDELSASQLRNIEKQVECKVLDRNHLILDIFARRARTAYARTQVELAQYEYLLPRLTRLWTHLERQKGGIGLRGPGETEIETDRRVIRDKIALLKHKLKEIDRQKITQRKNRGRLIRVALVGYTNVGKSTLMNLLSKSDVFVENKLFATLDTTVRKVVIGNLPFLLTDTVGFIRKLPHSLIESFKSTLDEVREADLLVHVADISHPDFEDQVNTVYEMLKELGALDKPTLVVFNKIDAYRPAARDTDDVEPPAGAQLTLEELERTWMGRNGHPTLFISATKKQNVEALKNTLYDAVKKLHVQKYPYNDFLF